MEEKIDLLTDGDTHLEGLLRLGDHRLAIILHPYAPLGGCMYDHVVGMITKLFIQRGYSTLRYNMRGAGKSQGRTSWTGSTEANDLIQITNEMISMMKTRLLQGSEDVDVVLVGYSFGSMVACNAALDIPRLKALISISYPSQGTFLIRVTPSSLGLDLFSPERVLWMSGTDGRDSKTICDWSKR